MYEQVDKPKENRSRAVANSIAQKKSNGTQGFGVVDNRPETVVQRKIQEMTNSYSAQQQSPIQKKENNIGIPDNPKTVIQNITKHLTSTPAQRSNATDLLKMQSPPIQRVVDQATAEHSTNNNYFVAPNNRHILYSDLNANAPLPTGLYARGNDTLNDPAQTALYSWTPNVRLFSNAEAGTARTVRIQQVPSDSFFGLAGLLGFTKNDPNNTPDHTLEDNLIGNLRGQITGIPNAPTRGVIGKNDCEEFATYLHHAIGAEIVAPNAAPRGPQETRLGDRMGHTLNDPNDCPYHYATIVATDAVSKVTLEANAGFDLTAPEFFIRNGITGFMNANNADYDNGQEHTITGIETSPQNAHQTGLQHRALQQDAQQLGTYTTTGNGGGGRRITNTVAGL